MIRLAQLKKLVILLTVVVLATHFYMSRTASIVFTMNTMYGFYVLVLSVYAYLLYAVYQKRMYYRSFATSTFLSTSVPDFVFSFQPASTTVKTFSHHDEMILTQKHFINWMQSNAMPFGIALYVQIDNYSELQRAYGHRFTTLMMAHYNKQGYELFDKNCVFGRVSDNMYLFVQLGPQVNHESKGLFVNTIKDVFSEPIKYEGKAVRIKKTIGIAVTNRSIDDDYILLNEAKLALEAAYNNHLKEAEFDSQLKNRIVYETKMMNRLSQAINEEKIQVVYQNIMDVRSNEVHAVEVLSRWFDVEFGNIDPESMLEIARQANLIRELDEYLIEKALVLYNKLIEIHHTAILSLNITPETFLDPYSSKRLKAMTDSHNIPAEKVCVEVSETLFSQDVDHCLEAVKQYHKQGFLIAIDDFGKAFSSLGILNKIPYDYLKIDRGLTEDIENPKTLEIIKMLKTVTEMSSKALIVEGIETLEQYALLFDHNCTLLQGFYIHKPEPLSQKQ